MPTGYTAPLHDGKPITFEQFVLRCARGMGAAIMQRDESLDVEIALREVDDHYVAYVEKAGAALAEAWARTDDEWADLQDKEITAAAKANAEYVAKRDGIEERYSEMLGKVYAWVPPTREHHGLRKFMIEQLEESISFDVGSWEPGVPEKLPVREYREREIGRLARALERDTKQLEEERERVRGQNAWVTALRYSLGVGATPDGA